MFWVHMFEPDWIARRKALIEREAPYPVPGDVMFGLLYGNDEYALTRAVLNGTDPFGKPLRELRRAA